MTMETAAPKHIYSVHFDIVQGCQLQCVGCPNSMLDTKVRRISVEDFARCLGHIDVEHIHSLRLFNYGEPLLHKQLASIVELIPRQKWKVSIVELSTNAQWVDWVDFEAMLRQEVVTKLYVSCDGDGTPEDYERLRPPAKWNKLIEFLERAAKLRDRWAPGMQLCTRTVVRTQKEMRQWESILRPRGWMPEFRRWMSLPQAKENLTGRTLQMPQGPCLFLADAKEFDSHPWFGEINMLHVNADGTVVPCCMHPQAGVFGNLMVRKYSEIMKGDEKRKFKQTMMEDRAAMAVCGSCDVGPVGNEGPSYWSPIAYWSANKGELPEY